uniref:Gem-associated protein 2 n=1 Tax=Anthurium amnicola TaxID=1678845 RepID=A0A1D1ZA89_9ARAE
MGADKSPGEFARGIVGDAGETGSGSGRTADMTHFEEDVAEEEAAAVVEEITCPEGASAVEDLGQRSVSISETVGRNGTVGGSSFDSSPVCAMRSALAASTDGSNEDPDMKGEVSTWKSNVLNEKVDFLDVVASDSQRERGITSGRPVIRYTREGLVALRFVDVDEQRQKWNEIYGGLETVVSREYDEISVSSQKKANLSYDQRQQQEKKKGTSTSKHELLVENNGKRSDALETPGLLCGSNFDEESWADEEESCNEDDSDDEYSSIQRPAFLVEGEPDFESGPPQDGLEYLRRVRWEAAQMPKVKVAKFDRSKWSNEQTPYMPKIPEIAKCPENLSPLKHWVHIFLADFSELRKAFLEFENSANRALCPSTHEDSCEDSLGLQAKKSIPTVSAVLGMDPVSRAAMIRNRVKAFETASILSRDNCLWLFALCVVVDTPLDSETSSCLRSLLRKCSSLLAKKSKFDEEVVMLQILVAISGEYFGQTES